MEYPVGLVGPSFGGHVQNLLQNGWTTIQVLSTEEAFALRDQLFDELGRLDATGDPYGGTRTSRNPHFFPNIPRVLGGMIKSGHVSLTRTAHEIRKLVRPKVFELLQEIPDHAFERFLDFERPATPEELSCNPDAVFVSDGKLVRAPIETPDKLWWHIDASRERSFLQSSFVLQNPDASEQFGVISGSHNHFHVLQSRQAGSGRMRNDWFMLDQDDVEQLAQFGCTPTFIQPPPGTLVVWFSTLVHTVKPADLRRMVEPRVQTYVCFGKVPRPVPSRERFELHNKVAAILFGATCRHLPYPCSPEWQTYIYGEGPAVRNKMYRDVIEPSDAPWVFGTHPHDFTDHELSVYGITRDDVMTVVDSWTEQEDYQTRATYLRLLN
jgi:hypothetical protein